MACACYETLRPAEEYDAGRVFALPVIEDIAPAKAPADATGGPEGAAALLETSVPDWVKLYKRDKSFAAFVSDVLSLFYEEDEVDPRPQVKDWVFKSSVLAKRLLGQLWIAPTIMGDDAGGLRISWQQGVREVRAVIPADLSARYLYWQTEKEYGGVPNFGSGTLYARLLWLNERDSQQLRNPL